MKTKTDEMPKTKAELLDQFIQIAIAGGYYDYDGDAEKLINETISIYEHLPDDPKLQIPKWVASSLNNQNFFKQETTGFGIGFHTVHGGLSLDVKKWLGYDFHDGNDGIDYEKRGQNVSAYLNPLTRSFVEVVE